MAKIAVRIAKKMWCAKCTFFPKSMSQIPFRLTREVVQLCNLIILNNSQEHRLQSGERLKMSGFTNEHMMKHVRL